MEDDLQSKIDKLERELYSKDFNGAQRVDGFRRKKEEFVPTSWEKTETPPINSMRPAKQNPIIKKLVTVSAVFFAITFLIAGFVWYRGSNVISSENILIDASLPVGVAGGEAFDTKLSVTNNNTIAIQGVKLFVQYPVGFYSVSDKTELSRATEDLGTIGAGEVVTKTTSAILYGDENTQKDITVILEYQIAGSSATLKKTSSYSVKLSSSPINLKLVQLKEISSGQEIELGVNIVSNSQNSIDNLFVEASYPIGFTFRSAIPAPTSGNNVWSIGTLDAQEQKTIKIKGLIEGQENEQKITKISIGTPNKDGTHLGVSYNSTSETLSITKPFLGLDLAIDGDHSPEHIAPLGNSNRVVVSWQSNNPTKVTDAVIEVALKGDVLDRYNIYVDDGGFYRSSDDTIVWDKTVNSELASVEPGAHGTLGFTFSPIALGIDARTKIKNPQITLNVSAQAHRISDANVPEQISTFATRTVKFETELKLSAQTLYFSGPFKNTGGVPPKANKETTYTVKWIVRNSSNNVSNAIVKTSLPIYVKWTGNTAPKTEDISYNQDNSTVTWNVGRLQAWGTREGEFQISFLPSLSQLNQSPDLTGQNVLTGTDDFTKTALDDTRVPVSTYFSSDPQFSSNEANVVE